VAEDYLNRGYYENALEYCEKGLVLNKKTLNMIRTKEEQNWRNYLYQQSLSDLASLYEQAGDYESSLEFLNRAGELGKAKNTEWEMDNEKAKVFRSLGMADSSFFYLRKADSSFIRLKQSDDQLDPWTKTDIGATYLMIKEYDSALKWFNDALPEFRKNDMKGNLISIFTNIGKAYQGKKDYNAALPYAREATHQAKQSNVRPAIMEGNELLSDIYYNLHETDSAYRCLREYVKL